MSKIKVVFITLILVISAVILTGCVAINNDMREDGKFDNVEEVTPVESDTPVNEVEEEPYESLTEEVEESYVPPVKEEQVQKNVLEQIREANKVKVVERFISFGKAYDIYIDGKEIATVSGNFIHVTGDVFKLEDKRGNLLAQEKQIRRWGVKLNRLAHVMDKSGNTTGFIGENVIKDFFSISKYKFHFYDSNKNEYAHTKEKILSLLYEFEVYDNSDKEIYKIRENFNLFVDEYEITKTSDSNVNMDDVIFLTCIVDAIRDSEKD